MEPGSAGCEARTSVLCLPRNFSTLYFFISRHHWKLKNKEYLKILISGEQKGPSPVRNSTVKSRIIMRPESFKSVQLLEKGNQPSDNQFSNPATLCSSLWQMTSVWSLCSILAVACCGCKTVRAMSICRVRSELTLWKLIAKTFDIGT